MSPEKTSELYGRYPRLYRGKDKSPAESSMSIGIECGDGWFDLIDCLSQAIEDLARSEGCQLGDDDWPEAVQVKQKAGALRFHLRAASAEILERIDEATATSIHTCEVCGRGDAKAIQHRRFTQTLCPEHDTLRA